LAGSSKGSAQPHCAATEKTQNRANSYERCQGSFERFLSITGEWFLGYWQAFLIAPLYPSGKRSDGARSQKSAGGLMVGFWNVSSSKARILGLHLYFPSHCDSEQLPALRGELRTCEKITKCRVAAGFLAWPRRKGGGNTRSGVADDLHRPAGCLRQAVSLRSAVPPEQRSQKDTQPYGREQERPPGRVARSVTARWRGCALACTLPYGLSCSRAALSNFFTGPKQQQSIVLLETASCLAWQSPIKFPLQPDKNS
jgi:hypothetical protein